VIGQSVFLPLLKNFPENSAINSQLNTPVFKLIQLDAPATQAMSPETFSAYF
jgi:hypothetical protein